MWFWWGRCTHSAPPTIQWYIWFISHMCVESCARAHAPCHMKMKNCIIIHYIIIVRTVCTVYWRRTAATIAASRRSPHEIESIHLWTLKSKATERIYVNFSEANQHEPDSILAPKKYNAVRDSICLNDFWSALQTSLQQIDCALLTAGYRRRFYTDNDDEYNAHHLFAFLVVHQLIYWHTMDVPSV